MGCHKMIGRSFSFENRGLTFGRADGNDLVLPDPECFVSSHHGLIRFTNGVFTVLDQSANGLYINQDSRPLGGGNQAILSHGTQLRAGNYSLSVEVTGESPAVDLESTIISQVPDLEAANSPEPSADQNVAEELAWRLGLHGLNGAQLRTMPAEVTTLIRRCVGSLMDVL